MLVENYERLRALKVPTQFLVLVIVMSELEYCRYGKTNKRKSRTMLEINELAEFCSADPNTIRKIIKKSGYFETVRGIVVERVQDTRETGTVDPSNGCKTPAPPLDNVGIM